MTQLPARSAKFGAIAKVRLLILCAIVVLPSCCGRSRSLEEIEAEKRSLPTVFITAESGKRIEAPRIKGMFVDEESGELAYPAYECTHPDCPGRVGDENYLFIHNNPLFAAQGDQVVVREIPAGANPQSYIAEQGGHSAPTCPKCLETRDLKTESEETAKKYFNAAQLYVPPATAKRAAELEEEYQQRFKEVQTRRQEGY